ncbi:hypothetical protein ACFOX2_03810 [Corynebacterium marambiense]|uniref:hypothetical protein n=1 Tax=Corynebacterium marambiense TaxID=2765364 RepID=UPI0036186B5B
MDPVCPHPVPDPCDGFATEGSMCGDEEPVGPGRGLPGATAGLVTDYLGGAGVAGVR